MEKSLKELITYGIKCIIFIFKKAFNKKLEKKGSLIIIWNWPSFLETIKNHSDFLKKNELLCVNRFVDTEYYTILKPKYYVIADSAFFDDINKIDTENRERIKSIQA